MGHCYSLRMLPLALVGGTLAACGAGEPGLYDVPLADAKAVLGSAVQSYNESGDGKTMRIVRAAGWQGDKLRVEMQADYADKPAVTCLAHLESVDDSTTRVTPDCTNHVAGKDNVVVQLSELEVQEFVHASMTGGEMDAKKLRAQGGAVAMKNMPEMQGEALAANAEDLKRRYQDEQDGWASTEQQQTDDGWGAQ